MLKIAPLFIAVWKKYLRFWTNEIEITDLSTNIDGLHGLSMGISASSMFEIWYFSSIILHPLPISDTIHPIYPNWLEIASFNRIFLIHIILVLYNWCSTWGEGVEAVHWYVLGQINVMLLEIIMILKSALDCHWLLLPFQKPVGSKAFKCSEW